VALRLHGPPDCAGLLGNQGLSALLYGVTKWVHYLN